MKTKIIFLGMFLLAAIINVNATVWTVSNNINSPGQFTDLQVALDTASAGDTIYVSGSPYSYVGEAIYGGTRFSISKQVTIIGAGYNPNNQDNLKTVIENDFGLNFETDQFGDTAFIPDGTKLIGLEFGSFYAGKSSGSTYYVSGYFGAKNITIDRCKFAQVHAYGSVGHIASNFLITNCIMSKTSTYAGNYVQNILVTNTIIRDAVQGDNYTVDHCIIMGWLDLGYTTIQNSIFYGNTTAGATFSNFNNNITYGGAQTELIYGTNTGSNNFIDTNPLFENVPSTVYDFAYDYHLQAGSPGELAGSDGTDIGVYGGLYPFPVGELTFQTSPMPAIPQVIEMNINTAAVPIESELNVHIKALKQD